MVAQLSSEDRILAGNVEPFQKGFEREFLAHCSPMELCRGERRGGGRPTVIPHAFFMRL